MSDDFRASPLSDSDIRAIAERTKRNFGLERTRPVNIIRCLESGYVETTRGRKRLEYIRCSDAEMPQEDGRTEFENDVVRIFVRKKVHDAAFFGEGRARMTLAHELAHAVLHGGSPKFRHTGAAGATTLSKLRPSESGEHQAKVFAASFLIHDDAAHELSSAEQIAEEFCVSTEAATICFNRLCGEKERKIAAERVACIALQFRKQASGSANNELRFSADPCPNCGIPELIPIGAKFLCNSCSHVSNQS